MGKGIVTVRENHSGFFRGHGVESRKRSGHSGKTLNKTICVSGGKFKPADSTRSLLLKAMGFVVKLISAQVEISSDTSDVKVDNVNVSATL